MIDEIKRLVENINECENEISNNESKLLEPNIDGLNKIVQVAIKDLEFENMYRRKIAYENSKEDEEEYYKDENGELLKGVCVDYIQVSYCEDVNGDYLVQKELYLMEDGSFKVFNFTCRGTNNEKNIYELILSDNQDIFQFDFEYIMENIQLNLEIRFKSMKEKRDIQLEKLEKLNKIK